MIKEVLVQGGSCGVPNQLWVDTYTVYFTLSILTAFRQVINHTIVYPLAWIHRFVQQLSPLYLCTYFIDNSHAD